MINRYRKNLSKNPKRIILCIVMSFTLMAISYYVNDWLFGTPTVISDALMIGFGFIGIDCLFKYNHYVGEKFKEDSKWK